MDEPFGALDALTRDQLNLDMQRMWMEDRQTVFFVTHSIEEAIFLSDRVVVMTPRPGRVYSVIDVDLPRPRRTSVRNSPLFHELVKEIRTAFEELGVLKDDSA